MKTMRTISGPRSLALATFAALAASAAQADLSNVIFRVAADNDAGAGSVEVTADQGAWDGDVYMWNLTSPVVITDDVSGNPIAVLNEARFSAIADPVVGLIFNVTAGASATSFSFNSGTLGFPPFGSVIGQASAGVTVTDTNNNGTAIVLGNGGASGTSCYSALYNGLTQFAELVPGASVSNPGGSNTNSGSLGPIGVPGIVSDMQTNFHFRLSAEDSASGTSVFVLTPEPASLLLVALGAFALRRRS
jgi:PEP-CTERM motif